MDDLVAFLRARLDEDEAEVAEVPWLVRDRRTIAAHKAILDKHARCACPETLWLAAIYSDHPDYRDEWKPSG